MAREGTGAASDPIDIVVKEENIEIDKGDDHDEDEDDENLVHLLIKEKIRSKIAILKIAERNPSCALTNQIYCKCYQRKKNLHVNVTLNIRYFWEMSPSLHVSGLLMPFTGEESKSLEFLVDCYNQSKKFKKATKLE